MNFRSRSNREEVHWCKCHQDSWLLEDEIDAHHRQSRTYPDSGYNQKLRSQQEIEDLVLFSWTRLTANLGPALRQRSGAFEALAIIKNSQSVAKLVTS